MPILEIKDNDKVLAIVITHDFNEEGIKFCTPNDYSQQLAYMHHPKGHIIAPHVHNPVKREVLYTKETLVIKSGLLRCDFYRNNHEYVSSIELNAGDVILLVDGGHGFECLEETEMYEIKQGPYTGDQDKTRFEPIR
ncbi:hypothetical protein [Butyrivibrio sp. XBB1001]|uniref:hypothetical protein n=1 Tax=Butyrivibrio sp. XBB1001 TaxID=1280682 RepID=UPI00047DFBB1|nr:hypothetical protein [Butyrivibrio sp. XBB1001]